MEAIVDIPQEVKDALRRFRFAKRSTGCAAIVIKIDQEKQMMVVDDQYDNITIEDLAQELPEMKPRYVLLSYELKHTDGRTSFPLVLINYSPIGSPPAILTLHASGLSNFETIAGVNKVIQIRDGPESFTKETIDSALAATRS